MAENRRQLALRVVSALVILPVVLWLVWLGGWPFAALAAFAAGLSPWELGTVVLGGVPPAEPWHLAGPPPPTPPPSPHLPPQPPPLSRL